MKTITVPSFVKLFMMASILIFSSCQKEEVEPTTTSTSTSTPTPTPTPTVPSNSFFAKVESRWC